MDAAAEGVLTGDGTAPLDAARRQELGEQLRDRMRRAGSDASAAAMAVADLAVAIHTTVPDPASTVFWDAGDHAEAYRQLLGRKPSSSAPRAPGRAISDAVGAAVARMLHHNPTAIVAVIDGQGLSAGLAFEAVNHAGHLQLPLVLVLVDAPTTRTRSVGAVSRHLTRLRGHPRYADAKAHIEQALSRMPAGGQAVEVARRLKNSMRELLIPTEIWEELLGFTYLGPIDGASCEALSESLALALEVHRPVLLHVAAPAGTAVRRQAPGTGLTTAAADRAPWLAAAAAALADLAETDELCVTVSAGSTARAALHAVAERVPERFLDVELGEAHGMALAASLAQQGLHPVVTLAASRAVATVAPLLADAAEASSPLTILAYPDAAHETAADMLPLCGAQGLDVVVPAHPSEVQDMLASALAGHRWTLIRLPAHAPQE